MAMPGYVEACRTPFVYPSKLASTGDDIRVLRPTKIFAHRLEFDLIVRPRRDPDQASDYTAISYAWGDGEPTHVVYLNGNPFYVRPNLWMCLFCICSGAAQHKWRDLWVDAICINQSDDAEKSAQVAAMARTYEEASCASVWLGLPEDHLPASKPLSNMHSTFDAATPNKQLLELSLLVAEGQFLTRAQASMSGADAQTHAQDHGFIWQSKIIDLLHRPYWTRRWVIEEFLSAQVVNIYCGELWTDCKSFQSLAIEACDAEHSPNQMHYDDTSACRLLDYRSGDLEWDWWGDLFSALYYSQGFECSDPRDRVFANEQYSAAKRSWHYMETMSVRIAIPDPILLITWRKQPRCL